MIPRTRDALSKLLSRTFPDSQDIDATTVDAFVDALMKVKVDAAQRGPAVEARGAATPSGARARASTVYLVRGTHARRTPVTSVFTGETVSVRVSLPQTEPREIDTAAGSVLPRDHLLPTVAALRERFGARIGRPFSRVDLVTPPRSSGVRFSPMSLYLGYETDESRSPQFVVFEPGTATGSPAALYLAVPADAIIDEQAGYAATPFASAEHWYSGGLRMAENGLDPEVLFVRVSKERGGDPYVRLHVEYHVVDAPPFRVPAGDLVEAALRMFAVQKGVGVDQNVMERLVADLGLWSLPWVDRPDNAAAAASGAPKDFVPATAFDAFVAALAGGERATFQASIVMLLAAVVHTDGKFDRLERIEVDWILNFEVPAALGDGFRFSDPAQAEYRALFDGAKSADPRPFDERLAELGTIVARLPGPLRAQYQAFAGKACQAAAASSGGMLWFGTKVSPEEKAVLDKIGASLGLGAPTTAFDGFVRGLTALERRTFQASVVMLLAAVVEADGTFDRAEQARVDWIMNFKLPTALGDTFRFSDAARAEHRRLFEAGGAPQSGAYGGGSDVTPDLRPFAVRLAELAAIVARLPDDLRAKYKTFVAKACRSAAESSGGWLWFGSRVSAEEKAVLDQIAVALGLEASAS
jgi:tellurite resistance protein